MSLGIFSRNPLKQWLTATHHQGTWGGVGVHRITQLQAITAPEASRLAAAACAFALCVSEVVITQVVPANQASPASLY